MKLTGLLFLETSFLSSAVGRAVCISSKCVAFLSHVKCPVAGLGDLASQGALVTPPKSWPPSTTQMETSSVRREVGGQQSEPAGQKGCTATVRTGPHMPSQAQTPPNSGGALQPSGRVVTAGNTPGHG